MYFKTYILLLLSMSIVSCQSEMYVSEIQENDEVLKAMKSVNEMEQTMFGLSDNSTNKIVYFNGFSEGVGGSHKEDGAGNHVIKVKDNLNVCVVVQHELLHHIGYSHTVIYDKMKKLKC